jgi:hypothetical protein
MARERVPSAKTLQEDVAEMTGDAMPVWLKR